MLHASRSSVPGFTHTDAGELVPNPVPPGAAAGPVKVHLIQKEIYPFAVSVLKAHVSIRHHAMTFEIKTDQAGAGYIELPTAWGDRGAWRTAIEAALIAAWPRHLGSCPISAPHAADAPEREPAPAPAPAPKSQAAAEEEWRAALRNVAGSRSAPQLREALAEAEAAQQATAGRLTELGDLRQRHLLAGNLAGLAQADAEISSTRRFADIFGERIEAIRAALPDAEAAEAEHIEAARRDLAAAIAAQEAAQAELFAAWELAPRLVAAAVADRAARDRVARVVNELLRLGRNPNDFGLILPEAYRHSAPVVGFSGDPAELVIPGIARGAVGAPPPWLAAPAPARQAVNMAAMAANITAPARG